jgi:hypothetical protein
MKNRILFVSLIAFFPACAITQRQHKPKTDVVRVKPIKTSGTTVPQSEYDTVRNGEVIKQYYAGAYVDPNNPNVRHNPHDIQRLEQAATWNLRPNVPVVAGGPAYVASSSAAQNGAIRAQLSGALDRQKGYTDALTQQNEKLQDIIQQLNAAKEQDAQARRDRGRAEADTRNSQEPQRRDPKAATATANPPVSVLYAAEVEVALR